MVKSELKLLNSKGFSLIEIMVALTLIALIFAIVPFGTSYSLNNQLRQAVTDLERSIRFANNEAILRNKIVRIRFSLESETQEYTIEYGTRADLVLEESVDLSKLSIKERELQLAKKKKIDSQFSVVDELYDDSKKLPRDVFIYGLATSYYDELISSEEASIYFYPTGERDSSLILLATEEEIVQLEIPPFEQTSFKEYYVFQPYELENLDQSLESKATDMFSLWQKK